MSINYLAQNKQAWNIRTLEHIKSRFYDVEGFISGNCSLQPIELTELGEVTGKNLLHLQCHFGMDSISFARRGAKVTAIDFSNQAIDQAKSLAVQLKQSVQFICCDLYQTRQYVTEQFDIVFTSYGTIGWLPDINRWAKVVADSLVVGGRFQLVEFHPYAFAVDGEPYFHQKDPMHFQETSYTENSTHQTSLYEWSHPISDVINALINQGLQIRHFNEFPYSPYNCYDNLEERELGKFYRKNNQVDLPMLYSIQAVKPQ